MYKPYTFVGIFFVFDMVLEMPLFCVNVVSHFSVYSMCVFLFVFECVYRKPIFCIYTLKENQGIL